MKNRRNLIVVAVLIVIVGFFLYNRKQAQKKNITAKATVKQGDLKQTLTLSGILSADEHVILRFQTAGKVSWVGVKKGDYVKKYQIIATLDQRSVKKTLQKELNDFAKSRLDLDQSRDDNKDKVITDTVKRLLEKYQYDVNNAVLDVELQDLSLEYSRLSTPIEGIVTAVTSPFAGVNIIPTQAEFEIVNPKTIYFTVNADQTEVPQLKEGMDGELILDAFENKVIKGIIESISYTPTPGETGTVYAVKFTFPVDNSDFRFRVGMTGDATFILKEKQNALYVPAQFVNEENGKKYVYIMKSGKKTKQMVKTGLETDDNIEITSGLHKGDTVYD